MSEAVTLIKSIIELVVIITMDIAAVFIFIMMYISLKDNLKDDDE